MRSPIVWFGGKGGHMSRKLLQMIPPHRTYVEVFGGGASLLFAKPPSLVEVYNDIDNGLYNFFVVLADPDKFDAFYRRVSLLPHSRQLYIDCRDTWRGQVDPVEKAWRWFVVARQSFSGMFGNSWSFAVTESKRHMAGPSSRWLSTIGNLPQIHARLQRVQIENRDWRFILDTYDTDETFFYLDPPYVADTRSAGGYEHELTMNDHVDLVGRLLDIKGSAMLSAYAHDVYKPLEDAGWQRVDWHTTCYAAGKTRNSNIQGAGTVLEHQRRIESVYISDPVQRRLL